MSKLSVLKELPKVELHLHLDGCIDVHSAHGMLQEANVPRKYRNMPVSELKKIMVVDKSLKSQKELLEYFRIPTMILQTGNNLKGAYYELCKMKKDDNVCYCEVRFAPQLHTLGGLTFDEIMLSVLEGKRQGERDFGILTNIIIVGLKDRTSNENIEMLEEIKKYKDFGVIAVDCAGVEADFSIMEQEKFLLRARELGFKITFHCGEVKESLNDLIKMTQAVTPDRIAHGSIAIGSFDFCKELIKKNIMLEICPTSNLQAGLYQKYSEVPLKSLYGMGVPISINTDDTVLSDISLSEELNLALQNSNLSLKELIDMNFKALEHSFADDKTKEVILNKINIFLKGKLI